LTATVVAAAHFFPVHALTHRAPFNRWICAGAAAPAD